MPKRFPLLALFLTWLLAVAAPAGNLEVAKVPMPQLAPLQWELLRQQQGGHFQPLRIESCRQIREGLLRQRRPAHPGRYLPIGMSGSTPYRGLLLGALLGILLQS